MKSPTGSSAAAWAEAVLAAVAGVVVDRQPSPCCRDLEHAVQLQLGPSWLEGIEEAEEEAADAHSLLRQVVEAAASVPD